MKVGNGWIAIATTFISFSASAGCLDDAADFAKKICGEVKDRGSSTLITASGELTAEAKGLIRQFLGSAGASLQGQTDITTYENVLHEQLAGELVNVRQCGIRMAEAAMNNVCLTAREYKTCADPSFGVARWANDEILDGTRARGQSAERGFPRRGGA